MCKVNYPSYEEFKNDGVYFDENGFRYFSLQKKKFAEVFCFNDIQNRLVSIHCVGKDKTEDYLQFELDIQNVRAFQRTYYKSPKFDASAQGYSQAIEWFEKWKLSKLNDLNKQDKELPGER